MGMRFVTACGGGRAEFVCGRGERWGSCEGVLTKGNGRHRYGYIGLSDRRMVPLLRPGSIVLVDVSVHQIEDQEWSNEHDRPMYFVELRDGYRCGWFYRDGPRLVMQPHPLSRCLPESWHMPEEAEIVGRVVGVVTRLNERGSAPIGESPDTNGDSNRRVP